uniref:Uncharacterized protein n=1 Tax=Arundo donax TaxID=35708 RepID=A0A0A9BRK2_ARUDO
MKLRGGLSSEQKNFLNQGSIRYERNC